MRTLFELTTFASAAVLAAALVAAPAAAEDTVDAGLANPDDPLTIVVSLPNQRARLYRGTKLVTTTAVSTGKRGHSTKAGIYSILEKRRRHYSNLYNGAPMPWMQRLTWTGTALHAGVVPGYPASHGCVRLPYSFAPKLFKMTEVGEQVVVAHSVVTPKAIQHPALFQPLPAALPPELLGRDEPSAEPMRKSSNEAVPASPFGLPVIRAKADVTKPKGQEAEAKKASDKVALLPVSETTGSIAPAQKLTEGTAPQDTSRHAIDPYAAPFLGSGSHAVARKVSTNPSGSTASIEPSGGFMKHQDRLEDNEPPKAQDRLTEQESLAESDAPRTIEEAIAEEVIETETEEAALTEEADPLTEEASLVEEPASGNDPASSDEPEAVEEAVSEDAGTGGTAQDIEAASLETETASADLNATESADTQRSEAVAKAVREAIGEAAPEPSAAPKAEASPEADAVAEAKPAEADTAPLTIVASAAGATQKAPLERSLTVLGVNDHPPMPLERPSVMLSRLGAGAKAAAVEAAEPRSQEPLRILVTRRTERDRTVDVQYMLSDMGYLARQNFDGTRGSATIRALKKFQKANDMPATGAFTDEVIKKVHEVAGKSEPPEGRLFVRQKFASVFSTPVSFDNPEKKLGTHLFTVMHFEPGATEAEWTAISLNDKETAEAVLDRINIPEDVRQRISERLTPGSSLIVADTAINSAALPRGADFLVWDTSKGVAAQRASVSPKRRTYKKRTTARRAPARPSYTRSSRQRYTSRRAPQRRGFFGGF